MFQLFCTDCGHWSFRGSGGNESFAGLALLAAAPVPVPVEDEDEVDGAAEVAVVHANTDFGGGGGSSSGSTPPVLVSFVLLVFVVLELLLESMPTPSNA